MIAVAFLQVLHASEDRVLDLSLLLRNFLVEFGVHSALLSDMRGTTHDRFKVRWFP